MSFKFFRSNPAFRQAIFRNVRSRAFTLVELMVVIAIIGLLAGVVTINVRSYLIKAKQNAARQDLAVLCQALDAFWTVHNRYPTNDEGLDILTEATEGMPEAPLSNKPIDPWGRPYQYNAPGTKGPYEVICFGADGKEGGENADGDLRSDELQQP